MTVVSWMGRSQTTGSQWVWGAIIICLPGALGRNGNEGAAC